MAKKIGLISLALVFAIGILFTGCTPARKPIDYNDYGNNYGTNYGTRTNYGYTDVNRNFTSDNTGYGMNNVNYNKDYNNTGMGARTNYTNTNNRNNMSNMNNASTRKSDIISNACNQVSGVENATAVVSGNTAYVGIDLNDNNRAASARNIENEVAQIVKSTGQGINTVYVSTEVDFMDRLRGIGEGMRTGRTVEGFTTQLNEMVRRITPTRW